MEPRSRDLSDRPSPSFAADGLEPREEEEPFQIGKKMER